MRQQGTLRQLLVSRILLRVPGHACLGRHGVLRICVRLLLQVVLVLHRLGLLGRHVAARHSRRRGHSRCASRDLAVLVLGRLDGIVAVNAVLVAGRLGRVQAGLERVSIVCAVDAWDARVPG